MLEHARCQELRLITGGAPVGIFGGHHLALLGHPESPADRSWRLRRDGAARGRSAARHRTAAAVEEGDLDAGLVAYFGELHLRLGELPVGGEEASVLV